MWRSSWALSAGNGDESTEVILLETTTVPLWDPCLNGYWFTSCVTLTFSCCHSMSAACSTARLWSAPFLIDCVSQRIHTGMIQMTTCTIIPVRVLNGRIVYCGRWRKRFTVSVARQNFQVSKMHRSGRKYQCQQPMKSTSPNYQRKQQKNNRNGSKMQ